MSRVYLDWNATTPLREEARDAMLAAMDVLGNPSSVHAEGRAARALIERAREDVGSMVGVDRAEVIFTSGATEAANLACAGRKMACADFEHDAVYAHQTTSLETDEDGAFYVNLRSGASFVTEKSESMEVACYVKG